MQVPPKAKELLNFIGNIEAPRGYDTIYGNNQRKLPKQVTSMTVAEILKSQPSWTRKYGSSATGRYQFMHATLKGLQKELKINLQTKFSPKLQDELGFHLLKRRGYTHYISKEMNIQVFGKNLAKEWASFPVLKDTQGAHRWVKRGQSYYAGDGVNKALVSTTKVETVLKNLLVVGRVPVVVEKEHWIARLIKLIISMFRRS